MPTNIRFNIVIEKKRKLSDEDDESILGFRVHDRESFKKFKQRQMKELKYETFTPKITENWPSVWNHFTMEPVSYGKRRHLWVWSAVGKMGKSTFLSNIKGEYYTYRKQIVSLTKDTKVIKVDDFENSKITASSLQKMCDGRIYNTKNKHIWLTRIWIVVCAGMSIEERFPNECECNMLKERFIEYNVIH